VRSTEPLASPPDGFNAEWDRATRSMRDGLQIIKAVIGAESNFRFRCYRIPICPTFNLPDKWHIFHVYVQEHRNNMNYGFARFYNYN
jgi:hypothetical protein